MNTKLIALALLATVTAVPASASYDLIADTGWQDDFIEAVGTPSFGGPINFTIAHGNALFSLTDSFIPGNIFKISVEGSLTAFTDFSLQPTPFDNNLGMFTYAYAAAWLDPRFSRLQINFGGPGSYSITVTGDCPNTCPAGFGFRLDQLPDPSPMGGVPEPASWALLIAGFGLTGAAMRQSGRRRRLHTVAA